MELAIDDGRLSLKLTGWERVWSLRRSFTIPLAHVVGVTTQRPSFTWKQLRGPGTHLPGVIKAGTYYTSRGKEFWYATRGRPFLVIELTGEGYRRIVLATPRNERWARRIREALGQSPVGASAL